MTPLGHSSTPMNLEANEVLTLGQTPSDAERVERILAGLWSESMGGQAGERSAFRLTLANLIVIGHAKDEHALDALVSTLAGRHPSRVLLALADPAAADLTATVSASCRRNPSGDGVVCWEKITLRFPDGDEERLASAMRALQVGRIATIVVFALPMGAHRMLLRRIRRWADLLVTHCAGLDAVPDLLFWDREGNQRARCHWLERIWEDTAEVRRGWARELQRADNSEWLNRSESIICRGPDPIGCRLILGWVVTRMNWTIVAGSQLGRVRVRRADGSKVYLGHEEAEAYSLTLSQATGGTRTFASDESRRSQHAWDDPAFVERVLSAIHDDEQAGIFLTAAGAAYRLTDAAQGRPRLPDLTIARSPKELAHRAAARFVELAAEAVRDRGVFRVALAGGRTPEEMYRQLALPVNRGKVAWERIDWFWGDERWVPHNHSDSNHLMAREALLNHVPAVPERIHPIPTGLRNPTEAAEEYELTIRHLWGERIWQTPAFDLILLGLGEDGHTASWFPELEIDSSDYRFVWGGYVPSVDAIRVTLTPRIINGARHLLFLAEGVRKADIVARTLYPRWDHRHPAARVEPRDGCIEWFLDEHAAGGVDLGDFPRRSASSIGESD